MSNAIAIINKQIIIEQLSNGIYAKDIAASLSITPSALYNQFVDDPDYQAALELGLDARLINRECEMECATDPVSVSRTRELLNLAKWRCEKEGKRWKDQQQVVNIAPIFNVIVSNPSPQYVYDEPVTSQGGVKCGEQG